jgi:hypothetical protein
VRVAILAGIDEAGFGPLLGPLVVSSAAFSVGTDLLGADPWRTLGRSVGRSRKHLAGRLLIADSKKAYNRSEGLGHLERTTLAALECLGRPPGDLMELLTVLCPDCLPRLAEYPWYQDLAQCRLAAASGDRRIAARAFAEDLRAHGASLVHLRTCCLDVAYFNRMVGSVRNKAQVLFIAVTQLIQALLNEFPGRNIHILVDRQGGRAHYRENLLRSFPERELTVVQEGEERSVYEMRHRSGCGMGLGSATQNSALGVPFQPMNHRQDADATEEQGRDALATVRLTFEVEADDRHLPVSLASMVSKYIRELLMDRMNVYFGKMDAGLKPTAGYWQDGRRFIEELRTRLPHLGIDRERLIRSR